MWSKSCNLIDLNKEPSKLNELKPSETISDDKYTTINTWEELKEYADNNPSETFDLEVDLEYSSGRLRSKDKDYDKSRYLSTHTFYESQYEVSTKILRECGFAVTLVSHG